MSQPNVHDITTLPKKALTRPKLSLGTALFIAGGILLIDDKVRGLFRKEAKVIEMDPQHD